MQIIVAHRIREEGSPNQTFKTEVTYSAIRKSFVLVYHFKRQRFSPSNGSTSEMILYYGPAFGAISHLSDSLPLITILTALNFKIAAAVLRRSAPLQQCHSIFLFGSRTK